LEITEVFYPRDRQEWRDWLSQHWQTKTEIWVQKYRKATGKPSIAYDDLVEECLCFGWIDGIVKRHGEEGNVQRITPRRKKSHLSELNRQRVWKLQQLNTLMPGALEMIKDQVGTPNVPFDIPKPIQLRLQSDKEIWKTFESFPYFYRRLRIGWILEAGKRHEEAEKRLNYLIKMTAQGKQYGAQPLKGWTLEDGQMKQLF